MKLNKIKEKIAKLVALCKDPAATKGEIDNAINLAAKIMAKFNLTREDIDFDSLDPTKAVNIGRCMATCLHEKALKWEGQLAMFCCKFIGSCSCYTAKGTQINDGIHKQIDIIFFFGSKHEIDFSINLFRKLREAVCDKARVKFKSYTGVDGRSYSEGFVIGLYQSLEQQIKELKDDRETYGLLIRSEEVSVIIKDKSREWLSKTFNVKLKRGSSRRSKSNDDAKSRGVIDGKNHSVTTSIN